MTEIKVGSVFTSKNYGDFEVIQYKNARNIRVRFKDTGFEIKTVLFQVRTRNVKDWIRPVIEGIGFYGVKTSDSLSGDLLKTARSAWRNMLTRCYNTEYHKKKPTYSECTVCDEWHDFQNFSKWYRENYKIGLQLDKDIKIDGNKVYGPETCLMVTGRDNAVKAFAKVFIFKDPSGEVVKIYNLKEFCGDNFLSDAHMCSVHSGKRNHHKGWTKAEQQDN